MNGQITISRPQRSDDRKYIQIEFHDGSSGVNFLTVRVDLADFAETLTGLARNPCEFELRPELVGKIHQHKEEFVPCKERYVSNESDRAIIAAEALEPFEVDGWKGRAGDLFNPHRRNQEGARVTFVRYVEPSGSQ